MLKSIKVRTFSVALSGSVMLVAAMPALAEAGRRFN